MALRTWRSITALTGTVPFTTRDTVAVETPAFFATSRMFTYGRDPLPFLRPTNGECDVWIDNNIIASSARSKRATESL